MRASNDLTSASREEGLCCQDFCELHANKQEHKSAGNPELLERFLGCLKPPHWKSPPVSPPPTHPPTCFTLEPYQDAESVSCRILVTSRQLSCFSDPPLHTSAAQTKRHKCKQEMNSIVFYFSINLSSWQVQQKIIKPSGGQNHVSFSCDIQNWRKKIKKIFFIRCWSQFSPGALTLVY